MGNKHKKITVASGTLEGKNLLINIDGVFITTGHFPSRGEFLALLLQDDIKGMSREEMARSYGFLTNSKTKS